MELLYLWIESFRNIEDKGFNFSMSYDVHYDKSSTELSINHINGSNAVKYEDNTHVLTDQKSYLEGFYGDKIKNISAIIGKNSTGKSNVLDFILTSIKKGNRIRLNSNYVLLFEINKELFFSGRINDKSLKSSEIICENRKMKSVDSHKFFQTIFFSNVADRRNYLFNNSVDLNSCYDQIIKNESNKIDFVSSDKFNETWKYVSEGKNSQDLKFQFHPVAFLKAEKEIDNVVFKGVFKRYRKAIFEESTSNFNRFRYSISLSLFSHLSLEKRDVQNFVSTVKMLNSGFAENIADLHTKLVKYLLEFNYQEKEGDYLSNKEFKLLQDFIEHLENSSSIKLGTIEKGNSSLWVDFTDDFISLIKGYEDVFNHTAIISHDWGEISSGMKAYLTLFAQLFSAIQIVKSNKDNCSLIICVDEGDLYMHPEWQRNFLNDLIKFINSNFDNPNIQIIMTSHSPFLISDLPKESVLLLGKNGEINRQLNEVSSFGANIHQLFANQFFLANEGTTGAFAKNKILELYKRISSMKVEELEEIEELIAMIGEPVLRYRLEDKLKDHIDKNFSNNDKIEWHKKQLKKLGVK